MAMRYSSPAVASTHAAEVASWGVFGEHAPMPMVVLTPTAATRGGAGAAGTAKVWAARKDDTS
jgi:hypothetical protein